MSQSIDLKLMKSRRISENSIKIPLLDNFYTDLKTNLNLIIEETPIPMHETTNPTIPTNPPKYIKNLLILCFRWIFMV